MFRVLVGYVFIAVFCTNLCEGQRRLPEIVYRQRSLPLPLSVRDSILQGAPFAEVARALGIPDLRDVTLPPGTQEFRLTDWYPMIYGSTVPLLRIVRHPGSTDAELYVWRGASRDSTLVTDVGRAIYCGSASDRRRVCVEALAFGAAANWDSLALELTTLGPCTRPDEGHVDDGGALLLQMLDGETYRWYECNAPWYRSSADAQRAAAAMDLLKRLARSARPR